MALPGHTSPAVYGVAEPNATGRETRELLRRSEFAITTGLP